AREVDAVDERVAQHGTALGAPAVAFASTNLDLPSRAYGRHRWLRFHGLGTGLERNGQGSQQGDLRKAGLQEGESERCESHGPHASQRGDGRQDAEDARRIFGFILLAPWRLCRRAGGFSLAAGLAESRRLGEALREIERDDRRVRVVL